MKKEVIKQYVIKQLIEENERIYSLLEDDGSDLEEPFIQYMIKKDYKSAFDICVNTCSVVNEVRLFDELKDLFFPVQVQAWIKYKIQFEFNNTDDFNVYDKLLAQDYTNNKNLIEIIFG